MVKLTYKEFRYYLRKKEYLYMFEATTITMKCKSFLKKYNIPYNDNYRLFKKMGMIHCQVQDWRGPIELDGFPVFSVSKAIYLIINSCLFSYYVEEERVNREDLIKRYPNGYGEYDGRKYLFEKIIIVLKGYSEVYYNKAIKEYTKYININRHTNHKWTYDKDNNCFITIKCIELMALKINKKTGTVLIYEMNPQQAGLSDNIYKYIETRVEKECTRFVFTNNGNDRYFLDVYNPKAVDETDAYILIGMADKIIFDYVFFDEKSIKRSFYTYTYSNGNVSIKDENIWESGLEKKYSSKIFFDNIDYVVSFDDEPEIELYDRFGNYYFLIAYKDYCDFYDKDKNYHKLNSIKEVESYVDFDDIVDIHDYGITPSIDYSRDIKEQTIIVDGKIMH